MLQINELNRREFLVETRKNFVLEAARSVFSEFGIERSNIREIAKRAGYTPGALYSYFPNKEAIFVALLDESIARLKMSVGAAKAVGTAAAKAEYSPAARLLMAKSAAWFAFYDHGPKDLELGLYLFQIQKAQGMGAHVTVSFAAQTLKALEPVTEVMESMGCCAADAGAETLGIFAFGFGLLFLKQSGGADLPLDQQFQRYVDQLCDRLGGKKPSANAQTDPEFEFQSRQQALFSLE